MKLTDELNSNKMVIVSYPGDCGGKFLINCLGLSSGAVFQDFDLARDQLDGTFTGDDKIEFLLNSLDENRKPGEWDDLNLGCHQMFQTWPAVEIDNYNDEVIELIERMVKENKYFFIVAHTDQTVELDRLLSIWKNPTFLKLLNCKTSWDAADKDVSDRITGKIVHVWQVPWYNELSSTLTHVEELYTKMGLTDFNKALITEYYNTWQSVWVHQRWRP